MLTEDFLDELEARELTVTFDRVPSSSDPDSLLESQRIEALFAHGR